MLVGSSCVDDEVVEELIKRRDGRHHKVDVPLLEVAVVKGRVHNGVESIRAFGKHASDVACTVVLVEFLVLRRGMAYETSEASRAEYNSTALPAAYHCSAVTLLLGYYYDRRKTLKVCNSLTEHSLISAYRLYIGTVVHLSPVFNPLDDLLVLEDDIVEDVVRYFPLE